jgi:hypothetical protein
MVRCNRWVAARQRVAGVLLFSSLMLVAGCDGGPGTGVAPDKGATERAPEVKTRKGGEARSNKDTDLKDLVPKKDR